MWRHQLFNFEINDWPWKSDRTKRLEILAHVWRSVPRRLLKSPRTVDFVSRSCRESNRVHRPSEQNLLFRSPFFSSNSFFFVDLNDSKNRLRMIKNLVIVWFFSLQMKRNPRAWKNKQFLKQSLVALCTLQISDSSNQARLGQCKLEQSFKIIVCAHPILKQM